MLKHDHSGHSILRVRILDIFGRGDEVLHAFIYKPCSSPLQIPAPKSIGTCHSISGLYSIRTLQKPSPSTIATGRPPFTSTLEEVQRLYLDRLKYQGNVLSGHIKNHSFHSLLPGSMVFSPGWRCLFFACRFAGPTTTTCRMAS